MTGPIEISSGGAVLRAEAAGKGRTVVMLHAGVCDRRMWLDAMQAVSGTNRAIAYDRRGFGETRSPDEPFRHVDDLDRVLAHFACERPVLMGCSLGGRIAIDYSVAHPGRVAALILVAAGVSGEPGPGEYPADIARLVAELESAEAQGDIEQVNRLEAWAWLDGPSSPEGRVSGDVRRLFLDMNGKALRRPRLTKEQRCPSAMEAVGAIDAPALVIWGDLDFPDVKDCSAWLAATLPRAEGMMMEGCAHLPSLEQPARFNRAVADFLASTGLATG